MNRTLITEEEKNRILEMHNSYTEFRLLNEANESERFCFGVDVREAPGMKSFLTTYTNGFFIVKGDKIELHGSTSGIGSSIQQAFSGSLLGTINKPQGFREWFVQQQRLIPSAKYLWERNKGVSSPLDSGSGEVCFYLVKK